MDFDFTCTANYQVELVKELPGAGQRIVYFPGGSTAGGKDGILLRFRSEHHDWVGCFAFGHDSYPFTAVFSSPNPDYLCIVSKGAAYWVNAASPEHCQALDFLPVLSIEALPEEGVLLLSDFITLGLLGSDGTVWRSPRLCWDELQIKEIKGGIVSGIGYDPINSGTSEWSFDLRSRSVLKTGYPKELGTL